jgi:hypothetical protein
VPKPVPRIGTGSRSVLTALAARSRNRRKFERESWLGPIRRAAASSRRSSTPLQGRCRTGCLSTASSSFAHPATSASREKRLRRRCCGCDGGIRSDGAKRRKSATRGSAFLVPGAFASSAAKWTLAGGRAGAPARCCIRVIDRDCAEGFSARYGATGPPIGTGAGCGVRPGSRFGNECRLPHSTR